MSVTNPMDHNDHAEKDHANYGSAFLTASFLAVPASWMGYNACDSLSHTYPVMSYVRVPFMIMGLTQIGIVCAMPYIIVALGYHSTKNHKSE